MRNFKIDFKTVCISKRNRIGLKNLEKKLNNYPFKPKINDNIDIDEENRLDIHDYL